MKNSDCINTLINRDFHIDGDVECRQINVNLDIKNDNDERLLEVFCTVNLISEPKVVERSFILNPDTNPTIVKNLHHVFLDDKNLIRGVKNKTFKLNLMDLVKTPEHLIKVCDNKAINLALSSLNESIPFLQQSKFLFLKHNS